MLDDFADDSAVTAANDEDVARVWMRIESRVRHHLLVGALVALGYLDVAVERQHAAVRRRLVDDDLLVLRALLVDFGTDLYRHGLARPQLRLQLAEPTLGQCVHRCRLASWLSSLAADLSKFFFRV